MKQNQSKSWREIEDEVQECARLQGIVLKKGRSDLVYKNKTYFDIKIKTSLTNGNI